ncbi:hypothetical protein ACI8AF_12220 [Blastococcus sp. SYSU D00669]
MSDTGKHKAGAFDVRVVIAGLLGVYGIVLVLMGLFADPETEKTGGVNANLWTGIGLVVVAGAFFAWARVRPVVVDEAELARAHAEDGDRPAH